MGHCTHRWETDGVYKAFSGFVDSDLFRGSVLGTLAGHGYDGARYVVNDLSAIDGHALARRDFDYLATVRRFTAGPSSDLRIAFVTRDERIAEMVLAAVADAPFARRKVEVFGCLDAARAWCARRAGPVGEPLREAG